MGPLPKDFYAVGVRCGIYNKPTKLDLALFYSKRVGNAGAVFTTNRVQAAPIKISQKHLKSGKTQVIVANSGCANAGTGIKGLKDAENICELVAKQFSLRKENVLIASTGVIGSSLPISKMEKGIKEAALLINSEKNSPLSAVQAIMTTDTVPKSAGSQFNLDGKKVTLWGCAKGAGMIHPNMATMLAFILTDAEISSSDINPMLKRVADKSFNAISVDGDTSTNDSLFLLANGAAAKVNSKNLGLFERELEKVCRSLALQLVSDGEGATKVMEIRVEGARSNKDAKKIAETVATSPLVKTALFGRDANWGRILAAVGRSGIKVDPDKINISFDGLSVARHGQGVPFSEKKALKILDKKFVPLTISLGQGKSTWSYFTCDFSFDYVKINADYRS